MIDCLRVVLVYLQKALKRVAISELVRKIEHGRKPLNAECNSMSLDL